MKRRSSSRLRVGVDLRPLAALHIRGFARYTLQITKAIAERDNVELIGFTDAALAHEVPFPVRQLTRAREIMREQVELPRLLQQMDIDVLWCTANRGLPLVTNRPTVLTLHDAVEWDGDLATGIQGRSRVRFGYSSIASLLNATRLIAPSHFAQAHIAHHLRLPAGHIDVVPEASSLPLIPNAEVVPGRVLYVGGFDKKKDVATLLRAFAAADVRHARELLLVGDTTGAGLLKTLTYELGIIDRVRWLGYVPDNELPALYASASCFVFPAVAEGFGLPVVEAMSAGTPVAVCNAGALPEVVGDAGLMFNAGDVVQLSQILDLVLSDNHVRSAWSNKVLQQAANFSWSRAAAETEVVLEAAAGSSRRKRLATSAQRLPAMNRWIR
jgi:glycosyltransferase involved in cell wall biosynthesis